jgi:hypothetical protein
MTPEEALAILEQLQEQRDRDRAAHLATLTAHVRRTRPRPANLHAAKVQWHHDRYTERYENNRNAYRPETYCGAPVTEIDWDRRTAVSKAHAAAADREVCPACLTLARTEQETNR